MEVMKDFESLDCPLCHKTYNEYENIPRMLPDCGHTFCSSCLSNLLQQIDREGTLLCPEDKVPYIGNKRDIMYFPKNFALLRILDKKRKEMPLFSETSSGLKQNSMNSFNFNIKKDFLTNKPLVTSYEENKYLTESQDVCKEHGKKLEIVCLEHQQRICVNCALFGNHRNHNIKSEEEVLREISFRADKILELFQNIEESSADLFKQNFSEETLALIYESFIKKTERISKAINEKFSNLRQFIKDLEKKVLNEFLEAFQILESKLKVLKKVPLLSFQNEISSWKISAKEKLISLSEKTDKNVLHFDLLENKANPDKDLLLIGQNILSQTKKIAGFPINQLKTAVENIEIHFNEDTVYRNIEASFCERRLNLSAELKKNSLSNEDIKSLEAYFTRNKGNTMSTATNFVSNNWDYSLTNDEVFKSRQSINRINEKIETKKALNPGTFANVSNNNNFSLGKANNNFNYNFNSPTESHNSFINSLNFQELIKETNPKLDDSEFLLATETFEFSSRITQNPLSATNKSTKPPLKAVFDNEKPRGLQTIEEKTEKTPAGSTKTISTSGHYNPKTFLIVNKRASSKSPFRGGNNNVLANTSLEKANETDNNSNYNYNNIKNLVSPMKSATQFLQKDTNTESFSNLDVSTDKKLNTHTSQRKLAMGFRLNEKFLPVFNGLRNDLLEVVDFTCADLGDPGIAFLAEFFAVSTNMKSLKLVKNKISDDGVVVLCKALSTNYSLANLNLTLNLLSDKAIDSFFALIKSNSTLKNIYLLQNNISVNKTKQKVKEFKTVGTNLFI